MCRGSTKITAALTTAVAQGWTGGSTTTGNEAVWSRRQILDIASAVAAEDAGAPPRRLKELAARLCKASNNRKHADFTEAAWQTRLEKGDLSLIFQQVPRPPAADKCRNPAKGGYFAPAPRCD